MPRERTDWGVAFHLAPVVFHNTRGWGADSQRVDMVTRLDAFSGGWAGVADNPTLARTQSAPAWIYYAVIRGERYDYVIYEVYHPIDRKFLLGIGDHPQDLEWVALVCEREKDRVVAGATLFHHLIYWMFDPTTGVKPRGAFFNIRPLFLTPGTRRVGINIQMSGHGIRPQDPKKPAGLRLIYVPHNTMADVPTDVPWVGNQKSVRYRLVPLWEMWQRRDDPKVFGVEDGRHRLVARRNGRVVITPATAVWCTSALPLVKAGSRRLSPLVAEPHRLFQRAFTIGRDRLVSNPFTE